VKLIQHSGLVVKKHYRPSQYSTLVWNDAHVTADIHAQAVSLAGSLQLPSAPIGANPLEQAQILDLAMGILEYQRNQKPEQEAQPLNQFQLQLSGVRSRINALAAICQQLHRAKVRMRDMTLSGWALRRGVWVVRTIRSSMYVAAITKALILRSVCAGLKLQDG